MSSSIVIDTGSGFIILDPTPENFHVASVLASQPVYSSNGEWDESKLTYANTGGGKVKIEIKPVRIISGFEQMSKAKSDADSARWKAETEKATAEKAKAAAEKERDEARAEIAKIQAAMVAAGVSVSYPKTDAPKSA